MAQVPPTTLTVPQEPTTTPKWLVHAAALLLLIAGPLLAFWDPSGKLNSGIAQALVVLAFVLVSGVIFVVTIAIEGWHKYGWSMKAIDWIMTQSQQVVDQDIVTFKNMWPQALPLLNKLPGFASTVADTQATVSDLQQRVAAATSSVGMTPDQVVAALEAATGMKFQRAATPAVAADPGASSAATAGPTVTT